MLYIVMCEVSGGVTGHRGPTPLKDYDNKVKEFATFDDANDEATKLNREMNGPHAKANFKYWAERRKLMCEGCGAGATLRVNGHPVCGRCVDLASEDGETPDVQAL